MSDSHPLTIALWRESRTDPDDYGHAIQSLRDRLAPQLEWPVTVAPQGEIDLAGAPFDTYGKYLDTFQQEADLQEGAVNFCLYHRTFIDGAIAEFTEDLLSIIDESVELISCAPNDPDNKGTDEYPFAGYDRGQLEPDTQPVAVVNTETRIPLLSEPLFENFVMHEALHAVLDNSRAPAAGDDHSYGTTDGGRTSPMLTGYTESISANSRPDRECHREKVPETNRHTTTLSDCTIDEVHRYMEERFGG